MPEANGNLQPTREQERAQKAFLAVKAVKEREPASVASDYGRQCVRLPILIQQEGLCQTVAFLEAKSKKQYYERLLSDLLRILETDSLRIRMVDVIEYQRLSREALRVALWLKRYSEAILKASLEQDGKD